MDTNKIREFLRRIEFSPTPEWPTPLHKHQAFQNDNYEMLKRILEKGVREIEITEALKEQCRRKQPRLDIIKLLLHYGAQIYDIGMDLLGNTPISLALENEHVEVFKIFADIMKTVKVLTTSRPEVTHTNGTYLDGHCALEKAVNSGNFEICALLIELGVDVNFYDKEIKGLLAELAPPDPPIVVAIQLQRLDIVKLLVKNGAHLNSVFPNGISAFTLACLKGNLEMVEYMLAYGANINALDIIFTPLHWAVHFKYTKLMRFLASNGASSTIKSKPKAGENNNTPIEKTLVVKDIYHFKMLLYLNDF